MNELELTLMSSTANPTAAMAELVEGFSPKVNIHATQWNTARSELVNFALLKNPPDVSEVGSTWIDGFASMRALRPFSNAEIIEFDFAHAFDPEAWSAGVLAGRHIYGIPWTDDARNIYYRRDLFERAGIDETIVFESIPAMQEGWEKLRGIGIELPWVLTTGNTLSTLHYLASWVWGHGGQFISEDGKHPCFNQPAAKEGIYSYFKDQLPYLSAQTQNLGDSELASLFVEGKAASIFSGYWLFDMLIHNPNAHPDVMPNLGIAKFPMPSFVGGSHLVVWKDAQNANRAAKLVGHLTSRTVQNMLPEGLSQIPARIESLHDCFPTDNPNYRAIIESLKTGRTFKAPYLWGMVEARLLPVIVGVWQELYENPTADLEAILYPRLDSLANRLALTFTSV